MGAILKKSDRRDPRIQIRTPCWVRPLTGDSASRKIQAQMNDISLGGMNFSSKERLCKNLVIEVHFPQSDGKTVAIPGQILTISEVNDPMGLLIYSYSVKFADRLSEAKLNALIESFELQLAYRWK